LGNLEFGEDLPAWFRYYYDHPDALPWFLRRMFQALCASRKPQSPTLTDVVENPRKLGKVTDFQELVHIWRELDDKEKEFEPEAFVDMERRLVRRAIHLLNTFVQRDHDIPSWFYYYRENLGDLPECFQRWFLQACDRVPSGC
jgi:hypothetical protein